jgi:hypothetical protein
MDSIIAEPDKAKWKIKKKDQFKMADLCVFELHLNAPIREYDVLW